MHSLSLSDKEATWTRHAYGEENCAFALRKADRDVTAYILNGLDDEIRLLGGQTIYSSKGKQVLAWDAGFTTDSDEMIVAVAVGDINRPVEVYTVTASGGSMVRVSKHGEVLGDRKFGKSEVVKCKSADGEVELEGLWITPASHVLDPGDSQSARPNSPVPTVVLPHGGPYHRIVETFDPVYFMWAQPLLEAGQYIPRAKFAPS